MELPFTSQDFWTHVRRFGRAVPFTRELLAAYASVLDNRTPLWVKGTLAGALAYFVLPVDAIPDVLVGLGLTDDASLLAGAIATVGGSIMQDHFDQAESWLADDDQGSAPPSEDSGSPSSEDV